MRAILALLLVALPATAQVRGTLTAEYCDYSQLGYSSSLYGAGTGCPEALGWTAFVGDYAAHGMTPDQARTCLHTLIEDQCAVDAANGRKWSPRKVREHGLGKSA